MPKGNIFSPEQYLPGHQLELVLSGALFFEQLEQLIDGAKKLLHVQVYIFEEDETGMLIAGALKRASKRGVAVFLAVDSYGSKELSPAFVADLKAHGIHYKCFSPLPIHFYVFRMGRRLHQKVMVADNRIALVGGINIANKYRGGASEAPWLDFAVRVKGPVCADISHICTRIHREKYFGKLKGFAVDESPKHTGNTRSRVVLNDWFRRKNQVSIGYRSAFLNARHSITIMASYFLPGRALRVILNKAAKRGVKVSILLPGKSDIDMAKRATRYLYRWMLRNNIQIYEWEQSILHGKLAVVDGKWATIGSYNLNHLSHFSSIEMNLEVLDESFAKGIEAELASLMSQSTAITPDSMERAHGLWAKLLDWASYTLARWIMLILFFVIRREYEK